MPGGRAIAPSGVSVEMLTTNATVFTISPPRSKVKEFSKMEDERLVEGGCGRSAEEHIRDAKIFAFCALAAIAAPLFGLIFG